MSITAKYAATCATCRAAITPGQKIEWVKGSPVRHSSCGGGCAAAPKRERSSREMGYGGTAQLGGRRTGCQCGSREDRRGQLLASPRNCRSCEHDA